MILRRVIQHVKAQNWFAVAIDFVIVVVGVFIGIQVANWNQGRRWTQSVKHWRIAEQSSTHFGRAKPASGEPVNAPANFKTLYKEVTT